MAVIGEMDVFGINKDKQYEVVDRKSRQSIEKINKGVNNSDKDVTAGKVWKSTSEGAGWADSDSMSDNQSGGVDITINGVKRTLQKQNETSDSMADNENGGVDITIGGTKKTVAKQADLKEIEKSQNELKGDLSHLSEEIGQLKQNGTGTGTGLSTEAIDKLEEVGNYLVYTTADGGSKWTELISILRNGSSGGGSGETVPATGISLDKTTLSFTDSATQTLVATVEPSDTTDKVVWTSNAESVATVTNGVVKPLSNGSATITATCGSVSATCSVTVDIAGEEQVALTSISATYTGGDVAVGTTLTDLAGITVTGTYSDGSTSNVTGYTLSGTIAEGSNTITVSYGGLTDTFTVMGVAEGNDYIMLEYIETPEGQKDAMYNQKKIIRIDTGFVPTASTSAEYKISVAEDVHAAAQLGGVPNWYLPTPRANQIVKNRCGNEASVITFTSVAKQPYIYKVYMDGTDDIVVDGTVLGTVTAGNTAPTKAISLFTYDSSNTNYPFCGRIYYLKLYENGVLIHDYVPCKNKDGIIGLYDNVEDKFLTSATTDLELVAGPEV